MSVETFYDSLKHEDIIQRCQSKIFFLRNFNNWIKSSLIDEYLRRIKEDKSDRFYKASVLDLGCGKGGDSKKWSIGKAQHVTFVDIAENSVDSCKERVEELRPNYSADFFAMDCTKELIRDQLNTNRPCFDLVSSQFVLHYSFKNLESANTFLRNAAELLHVDGYFIGSTVNACRVVQLCRQAANQTISNDVFSLRFNQSIDLNNTNNESIPLFGAEYHFSLDEKVDCPEYLVYYPLLVKLAEKHGLKPVFRQTFKEYFDKKSQPYHGRNLIERMKALECFPRLLSSNQTTTNGNTDTKQYQHAVDYLKSLKDGSKNSPTICQTLSLQEWEVSSLYIVFAFQKVRQVSYDEQQ